eukprot:SAG31_NODE_3168_length_4593_cov_205.949933_2_plen_190_part_00
MAQIILGYSWGGATATFCIEKGLWCGPTLLLAPCGHMCVEFVRHEALPLWPALASNLQQMHDYLSNSRLCVRLASHAGLQPPSLECAENHSSCKIMLVHGTRDLVVGMHGRDSDKDGTPETIMSRVVCLRVTQVPHSDAVKLALSCRSGDVHFLQPVDDHFLRNTASLAALNNWLVDLLTIHALESISS